MKDNLLISRPEHLQHLALARKVSKSRLSNGWTRPPVAWRDHQGTEDAILWRQFRSGPIIIVVARG